MIWCTNAASNLVVSIFAALVGMNMVRSKWWKWLYFIAIVIMISAVSLTGTRTAILAIGIGVSIFCYIWLYNKIRRKADEYHKFRRMMFKGGVIACAVLLVIIICISMLQGVTAFNAGKEAIVGSSGMKIGYKDFSFSKWMFSGREVIWEAGIQMLKDSPEFLLHGASFGWHVIAQANSYTTPKQYDHFHSLYLQTLIEGGIPALLLLLGFILYFMKAASALWKEKQWCAWRSALPLVPVTALIADVVESLTLLIFNYPVLPFMMLFMGVTIRVAAEQKACAEAA